MNLSAYTSPDGCYPQYVSINLRDGLVEITVRSPRKENGECGDCAAAKLTTQEFLGLVAEAALNLPKSR